MVSHVSHALRVNGAIIHGIHVLRDISVQAARMTHRIQVMATHINVQQVHTVQQVLEAQNHVELGSTAVPVHQVVQPVHQGIRWAGPLHPRRHVSGRLLKPVPSWNVQHHQAVLHQHVAHVRQEHVHTIKTMQGQLHPIAHQITVLNRLHL